MNIYQENLNNFLKNNKEIREKDQIIISKIN